MNVSARESIAIEDSAMGHDAAIAAGVRVIITLNDDTRLHNFDHAMLVVEDLGEPDQDLRVVSGSAGTHRHVTIDLLNSLLQQSPVG